MKTPARTPLAQAIIPGTGLLREALLIGAGAAFTAIAAQVAVPLPFSPVPVTAQTLAVLLVGATLGSRRGTFSMLAYIVAGTLYLPVFAGGAAGPARLFGPTGGYLVGFVAAAWLVGYLSERGWDRRLMTALPMMVLGTAIIYLFGLPWLAFFVGTGDVFALGLYPFVPGAIVKIVLATAALPCGWKIASSRRC